jgi:hypothetical protein
LRRVNHKSYTFTRILCHIADLMEADLQFSKEYVVSQNVLVEGIMEDVEKQKQAIIDRELLDFKDPTNDRFNIGTMKNQLLPTEEGVTIEEVGDIHKEVFSEGGILNIFDTIMKVANFESKVKLMIDVVNQSAELMEDEKFKTKFANAKKIIFGRQSKVLTGQQFLIKKLSKARVDKFTEQKVSKVQSGFKLRPSRPAKSDVARYQLVPLIPELVLPSNDKKGEGGRKSVVGQPGVVNANGKNHGFLKADTEEEYNLKLFAVDLCALLRIIYNGGVLGVKNDVVLELLNDKGFMRRLLRACNHAGWDRGQLSSKFLRLVNMSVMSGSEAEKGIAEVK